jgi:Rieske Fe-S protein
MKDDNRGPEKLRRRDLLTLVGGAAAVSALSGLTACGADNDAPVVVEVPLDSVPDGGRLEVLWGEMPVELRKTPEGIRARSMWCTHSGCRVRWVDSADIYYCACHEGKYDPNGKPFAGPPPRPLTEVPVTVDATTIRIGVAT